MEYFGMTEAIAAALSQQEGTCYDETRQQLEQTIEDNTNEETIQRFRYLRNRYRRGNTTR